MQGFSNVETELSELRTENESLKERLAANAPGADEEASGWADADALPEPGEPESNPDTERLRRELAEKCSAFDELRSGNDELLAKYDRLVAEHSALNSELETSASRSGLETVDDAMQTSDEDGLANLQADVDGLARSDAMTSEGDGKEITNAVTQTEFVHDVDLGDEENEVVELRVEADDLRERCASLENQIVEVCFVLRNLCSFRNFLCLISVCH